MGALGNPLPKGARGGPRLEIWTTLLFTTGGATGGPLVDGPIPGGLTGGGPLPIKTVGGTRFTVKTGVKSVLSSV